MSLDDLIRILFKPETGLEIVAHEVIEFFVYGNLYKILEDEILEDDDEA